jgi:hypothetical protein
VVRPASASSQRSSSGQARRRLRKWDHLRIAPRRTSRCTHFVTSSITGMRSITAPLAVVGGNSDAPLTRRSIHALHGLASVVTSGEMIATTPAVAACYRNRQDHLDPCRGWRCRHARERRGARAVCVGRVVHGLTRWASGVIFGTEAFASPKQRRSLAVVERCRLDPSEPEAIARLNRITREVDEPDEHEHGDVNDHSVHLSYRVT